MSSAIPAGTWKQISVQEVARHMSYSEPNEKMLVLPWDFKVFEKVPAKSDVIIHVLDNKLTAGEFSKAVELFKNMEITMISLIAKFETFAEFLTSDIYKIEQNFDIIITKPGAKRDFVGSIDSLKLKNFRFVMPLHNDSDRINIKILSSALVQVLIDLRDPKLDWTLLDDLITDQFLSTAPRAVLEPFSMLSKVYKTKEFDLSTIYYMSPVDFMQYDIKTGQFMNMSKESFEKNINEKIVKNEKCAFCEGFMLCKSFLEPYIDGNYEKCSGFFKNLYDSIEIKAVKEAKAVKA
jgi:hypothetical protein